MKAIIKQIYNAKTTKLRTRNYRDLWWKKLKIKNSLLIWRSFGGHSSWLVALTMAISKSFNSHHPNSNKIIISQINKTQIFGDIRNQELNSCTLK